MTPTSRSLELLRALGYTAQVVEQTVRAGRLVFKRDLWGCVDILAVLPGHSEFPILGVQACAGPSAAARATKAAEEPRLHTWLAAGGAFEVWAWRKVGPRGKRKTWACRRMRARLNGDGGVVYQELSTEAEGTEP